MSAPSILILNGPNLNLLGTRQPEIYGNVTLGDIRKACAKHAAWIGLEIEFTQSNHEGALIDTIQAAERAGHKGIILNAAGLTHTSVVLLDALYATPLPCIEIHLSNIHAREEFRRVSMLAPATIGQITGFGQTSYILALEAMRAHFPQDKK